MVADPPCPAGCGHSVRLHAPVRVAFNQALAPGRKDYDAISCQNEGCKCTIEVGKWNRLAQEAAAQEKLF